MQKNEDARALARAMTAALIAATQGRRDQRRAAATAAIEVSFAAATAPPELRAAFRCAAELANALAAAPPLPTLCVDAAWAGAALARTVAGDRRAADAAMNEAIRSAMRRVRMAEAIGERVLASFEAGRRAGGLDEATYARRWASYEDARRARDGAIAVRRALLALGSALARALPGA